MVFRYWNYIVLVVILITILYVYFRKNKELFESSYPGYNSILNYKNESDKVEDRHPIYNSMVLNLKNKIKKAHNYEYENNLYQESLNNTFNVKKANINYSKYTEEQPLNRVLPQNIEDAYIKAVEYISDSIKNSVHFDLPDGTLQVINPIQVVHDTLLSYRVHKSIPNNYILNMDLVLYREGKYQGKHVNFVVLVEKNKQWEINVKSTKVVGIVFEDKIGLHPVIGNDVLVTNQNLSTAEFPDQGITN